MTPTQLKKRLAEKYPEIEFDTVAGRSKLWHVVWTGGPSEADVRLAMGYCGDNYRHWAVCRHNTPKEQAVEDAQRDADPDAWGSTARINDAAAREAREAEAKIARRKAGVTKAAATRAENARLKIIREAAEKTLRAKLDAVFDGRPYELRAGHWRVTLHWEDGPTEKTIRAAAENCLETCYGRYNWSLERTESEAARQAKIAKKALRAERLAARLCYLGELRSGLKFWLTSRNAWPKNVGFAQLRLPLCLLFHLDRITGSVLHSRH